MTKRAGRRRQVGFGPRAFGLLVVTNLAALCALARCFKGPGELLVALPCCLAAHLVTGGCRRLARRWGAGRRLAALVWPAGLAVCFYLPLLAVDGRSFSGGLALSLTWHLVGQQLRVAFSIFSHKVAPVAEVPGLVLLAGWAAGAVAFCSEVLYADSGLPAVLSLVPAFDVVVFAGALGTSTGRAVEIAVVAGLALAFLAATEGDRRKRRLVEMARTGVATPRRPGAMPAERKGFVLPGVTVLAALAAGVVGPVLPGATSRPFVSWHNQAQHSPGGNRAASVAVSDFVEVAEQEVDNPDRLLFTVHSRKRTRETLVDLSSFDGVAWKAAGESQAQRELPAVTGDISAAEQDPPSEKRLPGGYSEVTQVIEVSALGGNLLPVPGRPEALGGQGVTARLAGDGAVGSGEALRSGLSYEVRADIPPSSPRLLSSLSPAASKAAKEALQLPGPVPSDLVSLAHEITRPATSGYGKAEAIQDYFLSGHGFSYKLPTATPKGAVANTSQSYKALQAFLFTSRVGYCQQYATAFAVLGRLVGLPTRIAIGFLPGDEVAPDTYTVTGKEVHAWPEVDLGRYGWVSFEPTPGVGSPATGARPSAGGPEGQTNPAPLTTVSSVSSRYRRPTHDETAAGGASGRGAGGTAAPSEPSGLSDLLFGLLVLALGWGFGLPIVRGFRRRRDRRDSRRAMPAAWREATLALAAVHVHKRRDETHLEFADRVSRLGLIGEEASQSLVSLAWRMGRFCYGRQKELAELKREEAAAFTEAKLVERRARRQLPTWRRLVAVFDPSDLTARSE